MSAELSLFGGKLADVSTARSMVSPPNEVIYARDSGTPRRDMCLLQLYRMPASVKHHRWSNRRWTLHRCGSIIERPLLAVRAFFHDKGTLPAMSTYVTGATTNET